MRDIRRPDWAEPIVERLTTGTSTDTGTPIFPTIMDLLIYAAGVGYTSNKRQSVAATGKAVPIRIFENNQKEGYIFLLALADSRDSSALQQENDDAAARTFEEYAAGGLEEIASWLAANPADSAGLTCLMQAAQARLPTVPAVAQNPSPL